MTHPAIKSITFTPWPTRPDGTNKTFGEMTREEQRVQMKAAGRRLEAEFAEPARQAALAAFMNGDHDTGSSH
jgi:hypothetical protein